VSAQVHALEVDGFVTSNGRDDAITDFAAGNLSPAKHAVMSCVVELNPKAAKKAAFETDVAATMMSDIRPVPLSPLFIGETLAKLPTRGSYRPAANDTPRERFAPKPLRDLMGGQGLRDIEWKSLIPGVAVHDVLGNRRTRDGDRLYLLRAKGGISMPVHSHNGEEWTLILSGSYLADGRIYSRGDLHIEDETTEHAPQISEGEDCICLVMTQGPLKMKSWLPRIVQQVVGI
jgi:putative transcriptional regulator